MKKPAIQPRKASFSVLVVAVTLFVSSAFAKDGLQIDKAYCGATGSWRDVTVFLQHQLKGDTLSVDIAQPFEEFGGDPAFGRVKNLIIDYRLNEKHSRLLLEEQYPVAFTIRLPSAEAVAPGADPRASAIMAEISPLPTLDVKPLWQNWDHYLTWLSFCASFIAIICTIASLVQLRRIKRQLRKA